MTEKLYPLVSAIITTKGRCELLKRAVDSVFKQTYPFIELIVVDDASTDETREWCKNQNFKYIRIPDSESTNGNHARNIGLENANGEFVAFLDDDDAWMKNKISEQINLVKSGYKIVYTLRKFEVLYKGKVRYFLEKYRPEFTGDISKKVLTVECITSTSSILFEKKFLKKMGAWDEQQFIWQDNELLIRCAQAAKIGCIKDHLTLYRIDNSNTEKVSNKFNLWKTAAKRMYSKHANLYNKLDFISKLKKYQVYITCCAIKSWNSNLKLLSIRYHLIAYCINPILPVKQLVWMFRNRFIG